MSNNVGLLALWDVAVDGNKSELKKEKYDTLQTVLAKGSKSDEKHNPEFQVSQFLGNKKSRMLSCSKAKTINMGDVQMKYLFKCQFN